MSVALIYTHYSIILGYHDYLWNLGAGIPSQLRNAWGPVMTLPSSQKFSTLKIVDPDKS
jgi:hypothetical protein